MHSAPHSKKDPILRSIKDDVRKTRTYTSIRKESKEVTAFYLSEEQRRRLRSMKRIKQLFFLSAWILKAVIKKLTPARKVMFVLGTLFLVNININLSTGVIDLNGSALFGGLFLILVILLELKDKVLAHSELEAGKKIQDSLMPQRTPSVSGWTLWLFTRSANEVCGDMIDFLPLEPGRFSISMADVAGKGLHAALITAKLQATVRSLAGEIRSLPLLVGKINAIVHRDSPPNMFSSMMYAECSEQDGAIRFINAGHFPALLVRGSAVSETSKGDPALGLMRNTLYTEQHISLDEGDRLVFYSDGLTEAKNESGEFFGKERFINILSSKNGSPQEIGFEILRSVDAFIGEATPSDDLSIIILQRTAAR